MKFQTAWVRDRDTLAEVIDLGGLSERELARQAGLSHATVNHLVSGRRQSCSLSTAQSITRVLGIDIDKVFVLTR